MGLETGTFVDDLVTTNPPGGDLKSQGDDHLRLIKSVLRNTFKRASKAFSFPGTVSKSANYAAVSTDDNLTVLFNTGAGDLVLGLPSLAAGDAGWTLYVTKTSTDFNSVQIVPASGSINSFNFINRSVEFVTTMIRWTGSTWIATRQFGVPIGSLVPYFGSSTPNGCFFCSGSAYNTARNIELFSILGSSNLPDLRGRAVYGRDTMGGSAANRVTSGGSGINGASVGATGGNELHTLTLPQIPSHNHGVTDPQHNHGVIDPGHHHGSPSLIDPGHNHGITDPGHSHGVSGGTQGGTTSGAVQGGASSAPVTNSAISINSNTTGVSVNSGGTGISLGASTADATTGVTNGAASTGISIQNSGSGAAHNNMAPTIICNYVVVAE